jgi:hypothetical protein
MVEMKPVEKAAEAVVDMKPVEKDVTVTQAGVEGKRPGKKKGKGGSDALTQETTEAVVEKLPTEKDNPDLKAPEAVIKGKGKGKKDAARDTEDVKAAQADVIGEGKGKCAHHEEAIEAAATVEVAKKLEGLHLVEVCSFRFKRLDKNFVLFFSFGFNVLILLILLHLKHVYFILKQLLLKE